jgi:NAD-dependent dihydropyrimidine dehydrogenase PreA subunit
MGLRYLANVVSLELNESRCNGCGMCLAVCPREVFALENGKARIADRDACIECGACQRNCPFPAVTVNPGVGCAAAIIQGVLQGTAPACGCSPDGGCCK